MKPLAAFVLSWLAAGFGAFLGSVLGNAAGKRGLFAGAVLGGVVGVIVAVALARRKSWLPREDVRGALAGGIVGFALAVPLTLTHMGTPVVPVLSCGLAGAGVLLGAGMARGWRRA